MEDRQRRRLGPPQLTVLGAIERERSAPQHGTEPRKGHVLGFLRETVADSAQAIYTDAFHSYDEAGDADIAHASVNHSANEWVRGDVHTNTIESVWSLLDRAIMGSYHKLSRKHLDAYLHEFEWRFNSRENPYLVRDTLTRLLGAQTLRYKVLTA